MLLWTASEVDFGFHRAVPENSSKNVLLNGSWESEYYFAGSADVIRKELSFKRALGADRQAMLSNITSGPSVCLHLRRTDILANTGHKGFVGLEYYRNSMEHMYKYVANPACYVFSDDTRWCGDNLPSGHSYVFAFVDEPDDPAAVKELNLMTHCQHFIVANSTFSGWGAWLAKNPGKLVIRPRRWFRNDLQPTWHAEMRSYLRSNDLIPAAWRRL